MKGMVLVVDDDEGVRAVMASALEDDGWDVETATNCRTALEALQSSHPGIIILDLRMPVMDGLTFADHYRKFPEPRAPLILISATVTEAAILNPGAVTGLRKPIDLNVLLDTVSVYAQDPDLGLRHPGHARRQSLPRQVADVVAVIPALARTRRWRLGPCRHRRCEVGRLPRTRSGCVPERYVQDRRRRLRCRCSAYQASSEAAVKASILVPDR